MAPGGRCLSEAAALRALELKDNTGDDDELMFLRLEQLMPDLLDEIRKDLRERPLTREFVLLKKIRTYWPGGQEASYFYEDHPDLENKVRVLQNYALVREITFNDVKRYVLTETLARYLGALVADFTRTITEHRRSENSANHPNPS